MFKRVERKRKRREEEEELGLDEDAKEILGLNDTDTDESDSDSESSDSGDRKAEYVADDDDDDGIDEGPLISVEEALKDPIYLISLDPTVHGCVLCKGKLIKNARMATAHKDANAHKRRFEHFKRLSANADPHSTAWELVEAIQNAFKMQKVESQEPSKRALKRQAKQAAIREKRRRHKELKARAIAMKALKEPSTTEETRHAPPSKAGSRYSTGPHNQPGRTRKRRKLESKITRSKTRDVTVNSASRTKTSIDSKKSDIKSRVKSTGKANKPS